MKRVEKILGADVELGNFFAHTDANSMPNERAALLLLAEIDGVPGNGSPWTHADPRPSQGEAIDDTPRKPGVAFDPQDWGRKYLATTGGCFYIDLGHLEACIPEVRSARDFVAAHEAHLRIARAACVRANRKLADGTRIVVMANNSDRQGQSWGGHLNVLVSRDLWVRLFDQMYPSLFVLASFQVSSIVFTGQGKVGSENGKRSVDYQITQRGDFFECVAGVQTTYRRPLCNMRDEPHVGGDARTQDLARLHVIFHDTTLSQGSNYLKAGVTQLVLAMLESGWSGAPLMLADPLSALTIWGHDPTLRSVAALADGREVTAVEHQELFAAAARRFVEAGDAQQVPDAENILRVWEDTLAKLAAGDFPALARRLDWVMKRVLLERMIDRHPDLNWRSGVVRAADLLFASLDPAEGLFRSVEAAGGVESFVAQTDIHRAMHEPPEDTRAWMRTHLLRRADRDDIERVNWDEIRLRTGTPRSAVTVIRLDDPRRHTFNDCRLHLDGAKDRAGAGVREGVVGGAMDGADRPAAEA